MLSGSVLVACASKKKLINIPTIVIIDGVKLVNPWLYFIAVAQTTSKMPAIIKNIQFIKSPPKEKGYPLQFLLWPNGIAKSTCCCCPVAVEYQVINSVAHLDLKVNFQIIKPHVSNQDYFFSTRTLNTASIFPSRSTRACSSSLFKLSRSTIV